MPEPMARWVGEHGVLYSILAVLAFALLAEGVDALDANTFRVLDVAGWALFFTTMFLLFAVMERLRSRWGESLAFGVALAIIAVVGGLVRGDGFDWHYVTLSALGGTLLWFVMLWLIDCLGRWAKHYGERHGLS